MSSGTQHGHGAAQPHPPEPIRVRKVAWALRSADGAAARLRGLSVPMAYDADDHARCLWERCPVGSNHLAPHFSGTCGFHGSTADPYGWMLPDTVLLDVELYGRVVRHERGWRASRQRVLGVSFVSGCASCRQPTSDPVLVAGAPTDPRWMLVAPRCGRCAEVWHSHDLGHTLTAGQMAGLLATEVSWLGASESRRILDRHRKSRVRPAA